MSQLPPPIQASLDSTKVSYAKLGSSGLNVSVPILGCMSFGSKAWLPWMIEEEEALPILKASYDRGINTWDSANLYSNGVSEQIMGKAIKKYGMPRENLTIMTKIYSPVGNEPGSWAAFFWEEHLSQAKDYVNCAGLSRSAIFTQVEKCLRNLDTPYIDVLQIHRYDHATPPEETMKALHDLVQSGKVRYIGASSMWATQFARLQFIAEKNGWTKFITMQNYYNLCYREEEREMNRFCKETGVGIIPYSPLFSGRLARSIGYNESIRSVRPTTFDNGMTEGDEAIVRRVEELANKKGWKMSQLALVWLRSKGAVPIVGANSISRIDEVCEIRGKILTDEEVSYLEELYVPKEITAHF